MSTPDLFEAEVQRYLARNRGDFVEDHVSIPAYSASACKPIKLGATYNVFDGEELLEASIASIRPLVQYVCVVYQTVSNFGNRNPALKAFLKDLKARGVVDDIIEYKPAVFTPSQKKELTSPRATGMDLGGASPSEISDQFFNELLKREQGRLSCASHGCTHFMSLDTDECYDQDKLKESFARMVEGGYHTAVCKMRTYFRDPRWELRPPDDLNYVPVFHAVDDRMQYRVGCPFPFVVDPTRKLHNAVRVLEFKRDQLEMHHFSFVRANIARKLENVSNRGNYTVGSIVEFAAAFEAWNPSKPLLVPNPYFGEVYKTVAITDNKFGISVGLSSYAVPDTLRGSVAAVECANCGGAGSVRCGRCKRVRYCGSDCQQSHWKIHKMVCGKQ